MQSKWEEINTVIEALSRDYVENDPETLEKEYQLQGKLREIISTFYSKIDAQKFTQMQVQSIKGSTLWSIRNYWTNYSISVRSN